MQRQKANDAIAVAYMGAMWTAQWFTKKKPQRLDKILNMERKKKPMTDEQMLRTVEALNAMFGGERRKKDGFEK